MHRGLDLCCCIIGLLVQSNIVQHINFLCILNPVGATLLVILLVVLVEDMS